MESIGLTAVFNISDFNKGKEQYLSGLAVMDKDTKSVASVLSGQFVGMGQSVLKFGAIAGGAALVGVTALTGGVIAFGASAISAASDAAEMSSLFNIVFGEDAPKARKELDAFAASVGRNKFQIEGFAGSIAALVGPMGLTQEETTKLSTGFAELAVDLSSFFNVTEEDALAALKSGLVGESEPLRKFGVNLNEAAINQKALNMGISDGKKALTAAQKAQVIYALVMEQTAQAQGDALRTSGGWANQTRALTATFDEFRTEIGTQLLPVITPLLQTFSTMARTILPQVADVFKGQILPAIQSVIEIGTRLFSTFQSGGTAGLISALGLTPQTMDLINKVTASLTSLGNSVMSILMPAFTNLASGGAMALLNQAIEFLNQHFYEFQGALIGIGAVLASSAIAAILAGIATAIGALLSPIGLLIAGAALLGAAWAGNWGNIQGVFAQFVAFWQAQWPMITAVALTAWQVLQAVWAGIVAALTPAFQSIQQAFNNLTVAMASVGISWGDVGTALLTAVGYVMAGIGVAIVAVISVITSFVTAWASAIQTASIWIITLKTNVETTLTGITQVFYGAFQIIQGILSLNFTQILSGFQLMSAGVINTIMGLGQTIGNIFLALGTTVNSFMTGFVSSMIAFWQNLYMTLVGGSIVPDMATAIVNIFTMMVGAITTLLSTAAQPIIDIFNAISATVQTVMSNLFSGVGTVSLDLTTLTTVLPQAILTNINLISQMLALLTNINTMIAVTLPVSLKTFRDIAIQCFDEMITKLTDIAVRFSTIQSAILSTQSAIQTLATLAGAAFATLNATIGTSTTAFSSLRDAANNAKSSSENVANTASKYSALKSAIDGITASFNAMAAAANAANVASSGAASSGSTTPSVGLARGIGFAGGTPDLGIGYKIPSGYPNDSYGPLFVQTGEEMLVTPKGMSIEDLIFRKLSGLNMSQPKQSPTVNIYTGDINNGMDLSMLENFITTTVANSIA